MNYQIKGIKVARGYQPLTHLFFADDSILFCRVSLSKWQYIQALLGMYEAASG